MSSPIRPLFPALPDPRKKRGLLDGGAVALPDQTNRATWMGGDQGLLQAGGEVAKSVGRAGAQIAPAIWNAVKADPAGAARSTAKFVGEEIISPTGAIQRAPENIREGNWGELGLDALAALPLVGAIGKGMSGGGRFLAANGDDYLSAAQRFAKEKPLESGFVTIAAPAEGERVFLTAEGKAGFKLAPNEDGTFDIRGLFNHGTKGDGTVGLVEAVRAGGATLDNYDTPLSRIYDAAGFKTTERFPFDRSQSTLDPSFGEPDYTMRRLAPEYAAVINDPSKTAEQVAAEINAARKAGKDILGNPLAEVTGTASTMPKSGGTRPAPGLVSPESPQQLVEAAASRVPARAPSITDTDAAAARAGLLGPTLPPNSVHQAAQTPLPRATPRTAPAKAKNEAFEKAAVKALKTPSFDEAIRVGKEVQAERWYDTDRIVQMWKEELGPEEGEAAYRRFAQMVAATSPGAQVPVNIRRASREYMLDRRGLLADDLKLGNKRELPKGYAARYQGTNNGVLKGLMDTGEIASPKAASFAENLSGNADPATIDRHFLRAFNSALPKSSKFKIQGDAPSPLEYGALERAFKARAAELGMTPAEMQAAWWVGKGGETNMLSGSASFEEHFAERVLTTAKELKMDTPEGRRKVAGMFIRGEIPLLGVGGAAAVGATQTAPNQEGRGPRGLL